MIFKSRTRRKVEIEILKLKLQLKDIEIEKQSVKANDTKKQVDLIIRCKSIERDIELYRKVLTK
jgi:hypothetical protein